MQCLYALCCLQEIANYYTSAQAAVKAVQAGVDLLLMPSDFSGAYQGVLNAVYNGEISEERLNGWPAWRGHSPPAYFRKIHHRFV